MVEALHTDILERFPELEGYQDQPYFVIGFLFEYLIAAERDRDEWKTRAMEKQREYNDTVKYYQDLDNTRQFQEETHYSWYRGQD